MDTEDLTMEEKCENLMSIVVESRKRFSKMCVDYGKKISLMENKILDVETNYRFKPKKHLPVDNATDSMNDFDKLIAEIVEDQERIKRLRLNLNSARSIVLQLKNDSTSKRQHRALTVETLISAAKAGKQ